MSDLGGGAVRTALAVVGDLLDRVPDGSAPVPVMGRPVTGVVHHVAAALAWYSHDLAAGADEVSAADLVARPDATLGTTARSLAAWGEVLARTLDGAAPAERGRHSHGVADPTGFAAIACAELLVHGADVAGAVGLDWQPPAEIAAAVRDRLFPDVPAGDDPLTDLLWATGRLALPDRPRRGEWRYAMRTPAG